MKKSKKPNITVIQKDLTTAQLKYYLKRNVIAVDCEMMGLKVKRDRLCLVQIGDDSKKVTLVQITQGQRSAPRLKKLLETPSVLKLFHFARSDTATLLYWLGIRVHPVFCTKIGSKLCRTYTDQHGLKSLAQEFLGIELDKTQQSSDWGNKKLSQKQIQYAAQDVLYLIDIYRKMVAQLEREGRLKAAIKCANFIPTLSALDFEGFKNILEY